MKNRVPGKEGLLITLTFSWMLLLASCSPGILPESLGIPQTVTWLPCETDITIGCKGDKLLVLRSVTHRITCAGYCPDGCRSQEKDALEEHAGTCNMKENCSIPPLQCGRCYDINSEMSYMCVPSQHFYPICGDQTRLQGLTWGILVTDMFPSFISLPLTGGCYMIIDTPDGWSVLVEALLVQLPKQGRIDVCSGKRKSFNCTPPGDTEHRGQVTIHIPSISMDSDSTRFVLQFKVFDPQDVQTTTNPTERVSNTTLSMKKEDVPTKSPNKSNDSAGSSHSKSPPIPSPEHNISTVQPTKLSTSPDNSSIVVTQLVLKVLVGLIISLIIVVVIVLIVFIFLYRRSKADSAIRRVVVVMVSEPTKRLSRLSGLSALFRASSDRKNPRYSNPPDERIIMHGHEHPLTIQPALTETSAQTVLSMKDPRGKRSPITATSRPKIKGSDRLPLPRKTLKKEEIVVEVFREPVRPSERQEGTHMSEKPARSVELRQPRGAPARDEFPYDSLTSVVLPSAPALESSRSQTGRMTPDISLASSSSERLDRQFEDDEATIVENDTYSEIGQTMQVASL